MRKLTLLAATAIAATSLSLATPALATVQPVPASTDNGTLVHGNGGPADVGLEVTGDLGSGPTQQSNYVHFNGSTTITTSTTDSNMVMLQNGSGQAELTGSVFSGNTNYLLQSGNIFLSNHDGMTYIELSFGGITSSTMNFVLQMAGEPDAVFNNVTVPHDSSGESHFAFQTDGIEQITNLFYSFNGGTATDIRQVRIIPFAGPNSVPEPATWALMLLGFGAAGVAMRRNRRKALLTQIA